MAYWKERLADANVKMGIAQGNLKRLENQLLEKQIDIKGFQTKKEQTEIQIAELDDKINTELPSLREKLIAQYKTEKENKLKNYNPIDFIKERAEENKSFFKLAPTEEKKVAEKENIQQEIKQKQNFRR